MTSILEVQNLTIGYEGNIAVRDISLAVSQGDLLGIIGPNGAGKTTMFRAIFGLQPYRGQIRLFGYGPDKHRALIPLIGYVPQKIEFEPNFPATVGDIVSMGVIPEKRLARGAELIRQCGYHWNRIYKKIESRDGQIGQALRTVGLEHLRDRRIGELSGGELQRVFIAKSLINDPMLLVLDEPVTSVDVEAQIKFYNVIQKINRENNTTIIISSHDLDAIEKYSTKVACMNKKLFYHGEKKTFFEDEEKLKTYTESAMQMHMHNH